MKKLKEKISVSRSRGTFWAAGALLLLGVLAFFLSPGLFWEDPPTGFLPLRVKRVLVYGLLLLLCEALVFLRIDLSPKTRRRLSYLLLPAGSFLAFAGVELINGTNFPLWFRPETFRPAKLLGNFLCYFFVFLLLYGLFRSAFAACAAGGAAFLLFGIANYFTGEFRGTPILPWDLITLGTAFDVIGGYTLALTWRILGCLAVYVLFLCLVFCLCGARPLPEKRGRRLWERGISLAASALVITLIFPCDVLPSMDIEPNLWNQLYSSHVTGIMSGFFENSRLMWVKKPEGLNSGEVTEATVKLPEASPSLAGDPVEDPVIIVVMNESLTDFTKFSDLEYTEDFLPYYHSLEASGQVICGSAYASVFGGGTCNSEFEFLTGGTTAFLPIGSRPYQQYVAGDVPSLAWSLKELGYRTVAIHPGEYTAWQRHTAYPRLGFDSFISLDAFHQQPETKRVYADDFANYREVIYQYEDWKETGPENGETGLFLFNVTIQNHGSYDLPGRKTTVQLREEPGKYPLAEQYLSLIQDSDAAFRELTEYFAGEDRSVVILMFGDHWPKLEEEFIARLLGGTAGELPLEDAMEMYRVPFMIWANYPLEAMEIQGTSLNYLSGFLCRAADLKETGYQRYLEGLRQELPAITALGFRDAEGVWYETGAESPWDLQLNAYNILEYRSIFQPEERDWSFYTDR